MQTFQIKDLIEFLEQNPETFFDYAEPCYCKKGGCLLNQFFRSKDIKFTVVDERNGWQAINSDNNNEVVAEIQNTKNLDLREVHLISGVKSDMTGKRILKQLKKEVEEELTIEV